MYNILVIDMLTNKTQTRRYSSHKEAMEEWDKTLDNLIPGRQKAEYRVADSLRSSYEPMMRGGQR